MLPLLGEVARSADRVRPFYPPQAPGSEVAQSADRVSPNGMEMSPQYETVFLRVGAGLRRVP
jgi:hypothetical protein